MVKRVIDSRRQSFPMASEGLESRLMFSAAPDPGDSTAWLEYCRSHKCGPAIEIGNAIVAENDASATLVFPVTLSKTSKYPVSVSFQTQDKTADAADYLSRTGLLTIPAGKTQGSIEIPVLDDKIHEAQEDLIVVLSNAVRGVIADSLGTGTIIDNDEEEVGSTPSIVSVAAGAPAAMEQGAVPGSFIISRDTASAEPLPVRYTLKGTAINGTDYETLSGVATILAGETSAVVTVTPKDDAKREGNESVVLVLEPGEGYSLASASAATVKIVDHDLRHPKAVVKSTVGMNPETNGYEFRIVIRDETAVSVSTLKALMVLVSGPEGYLKRAKLIDAVPVKDCPYVRLTFSIPRAKPWSVKHNGRYVVWLKGEAVTDRAGNPLRTGRLGRFLLDANDVVGKKK